MVPSGSDAAAANEAVPARVLLLHGLWMVPQSMGLMASRLRQDGFDAQAIAYSTVRGGPEQAMAALIDAADDGPCHVVAHSLGGLCVLAALERHPQLPVQRVVCLGSPLCGSAAAQRLSRLPGLGRAIGRSTGLLTRGCHPWQGAAQVGVIAGTQPLGLGQFLGRFKGPSDGTVAVAETRLPGLTDHVEVATSHTGMLISPEIVRQTAAFLKAGRFVH